MKKITFGFILSILVLGFVAMQKASDAEAQNTCVLPTGQPGIIVTNSSGYSYCTPSNNTTGFPTATLGTVFTITQYIPGLNGGGPWNIFYVTGQQLLAQNSTLSLASFIGWTTSPTNGETFTINIPIVATVQVWCVIDGKGSVFTGPGTFTFSRACTTSNYGPPNGPPSGTIFTLIQPLSTLTSASVSGTVVTVYGSNFSSAGNTVKLTNSSGSVTTVSNVSSSNGTSLTFTLPTGYTSPGTYSVAVEASGGTSYSNSVSFNVNVPTPTLTSASVSGDIVTVKGSNMSTTGNIVQISGSGVSTVTLSNISSSGGTTMVFTLPNSDSAPGTYSVKVEASGGTAYSNSVSFAVVAPSNLAAQRSPTNIDQIGLTWNNANTGVTGYSIERSFAASGGYTVVGTVSGASNTSYLDDLSSATITGASDLYRVRSKYADGTYSAYSNIATVSNCISEGGTGAVTIAFERGDGWGPNPVAGGQTLIDNSSDYLTTVTNIMNVIKNTNPFKSYGGNISFLADMQQISQSSLWNSGDPISSPSGAVYYNTAASGIVKSTSSCQATVYITLINTNNIYYAYTDSLRVLYLNVANSHFSNPTNYANLGHVATHELGHALSTLNDEYSPKQKGTAIFTDVATGVPFFLENCTQDPYAAYSDASGKLYGSVFGDIGCGTYKTDDNSYPWLRPSADSIMNSAGSGTADNERFNTISCGWIIAALDGQPMTQTNAATHFAECSNMDGIAGTGEFPVNSKPPAVVVVGGFGTGSGYYDGIYKWAYKILPSEVQISNVTLAHHTDAINRQTIQQDINAGLADGRPVIVMAHSYGAYLAKEISDGYAMSNVQFIYVDPPYNFILNQFGTLGTVTTWFKNNPSSIVNWTNGNTLLNFDNHQAFDEPDLATVAPNGLSNKQNLINLQNTLLSALGSGSVNAASYIQVATSPLTGAPIIDGIEDQNGNPISSISPGETVTLTGNFGTGNSLNIDIQDQNDPLVFYGLYNYVSTDGSTLTFTLPQYFDLSDSEGSSDTVPGTYNIQVAGYSSDWSNVVTTQITTTATPPPVPGNITTDPNVPNQFIVAGSGFSATGNSIGLTAQSVAMTAPKTGSFNLASALSGFLQSVGSIFTGKSTHQQISVSSIPATQKPVSTSATTNTKTTNTTTATKTTSTVVTSSVVAKTTTMNTTTTVSTPTYIISGLPSSGSGVTFQIPGSMPNGVYTVSVRSLNTPWVTTSNAIAVSNNSSGIGPTSTTTANTTCPTGYTLSGSTCNPNLMPTSLTASAGTIQNSGSIILSWINPAYAVSATGISIESASSASGPFSVIGTVSALANTYTDTGISPSQTKYYRIQAMFSGNLYGPYTAIVYTVTPTLLTPTTLTTTVKGVLGGQIKLTWSGGSDQFYVYDVSQSDPIGTTTNKSYIVSGLQSNTSYCYVVVAHNSPTYISPNSNQACAIVPVVSYPVPASMSIAGGISDYTTFNDAIVLNWALPAKSTSYLVTGIEVERSSVSSTTGFSTLATVNSSTTTSYTDTTTGLITNTTYYYRARIIFSNSSGSVMGPYSSVVNTSFILSSFQDYINSAFMNPKTCGEGSKSCISKFKASQPSPGPVNLSWTMTWAPQTYIASIYHYQYVDWSSYGWMSVQRSLAKDSGFAEINLGPNSSSYTDANSSPGTKYYYRLEPVIHTKLFGTTYATATAAINISTKDFSAPSISASATTSSAVYLTWTWKNAGSATPTYTVSETSPSSVTFVSNVGSHVFDGLAPSTKYCFTVTARLNDIFVSPASKQVCATTKKATATGKTVTSADTVTTSNVVTKDATTVGTDTTSSSVTTPVDTTITTSPGTTVTSTVAPTVTTSCPAGYLKFGQTCKKLNSTVPVTKKYSCPTGYVFDSVNVICNQSTSTTDTTTATTTDSVSIASTTASTDVVQPVVVTTPVDTTVPVSVPTSVPATITYSCATSGYVLNGSQCTLTTTIPATAKISCPTGYVKLNNTCKNLKGTTDLVTNYSCTSGYTLNTDGTTCSSTSVTVPATATYSCATGSILDNATKTCTQSTSAAFATSTTTASVFDSITHWFGSFFGW
jgi:hypothetical protein